MGDRINALWGSTVMVKATLRPGSLHTETIAKRDQLLAEADRLLEEKKFAGAVGAFRAVAVLEPLDDVTLAVLAIAEGNEQIAFRRRVARLFPRSVDLALAEVEALTRSGFGAEAVARGTELLGGSGLMPNQTFRFRHARLRAAARALDLAIFEEDFVVLWNEPGRKSAGERQELLRALAMAIFDAPELLDALQAIWYAIDDRDVRQVIVAKVEQLAVLKRANDAAQAETVARRATRQN